MKKTLFAVVFCAIRLHAGAQVWEISAGAGMSFGKLLPTAESSPRSSYLSYGFGKPGVYFAPDLAIKVSPHSRFLFGYQYSDNKAGVKLHLNGASDYEFDIIDLHCFSVGYGWEQLINQDRTRLGAYARAGLAYGYMDGLGGGGSVGEPFSSGGGLYSGSSRTTQFEVMPDFWTPTTTIGFTCGREGGTGLFGRLSLNMSATLCWKNPYKESSKFEYALASGSTTNSGTVQYQGRPLLLQCGLEYRLFRWGKL